MKVGRVLIVSWILLNVCISNSDEDNEVATNNNRNDKCCFRSKNEQEKNGNKYQYLFEKAANKDGFKYKLSYLNI